MGALLSLFWPVMYSNHTCRNFVPPKEMWQSSSRSLEWKAIVPVSRAQYFTSSYFQRLTLKMYTTCCFILNLTRPANRFSLPGSHIPQVLPKVTVPCQWTNQLSQSASIQSQQITCKLPWVFGRHEFWGYHPLCSCPVLLPVRDWKRLH